MNNYIISIFFSFLTFFFTIFIIFFAPEVYRKLNLLLIKIIGYSLILQKKINNLLDKLTINNNEKIKIIVNNSLFYNSLNDLKKNKYTKYKSLLIKYFINKKEFYILYSDCKIDDIKFPIYTFNEVKKKNPFDQTNEDIILVEIKNNNIHIDDNMKLEILKIIKKFSGPKGNFYEDKHLIINKSYIIDYINNILNIELNLDTINFVLIYSNGFERII
tara:strand:- start:3245 stop:3895 length:651 start_codon:yes stop_codon:yes gene_type:complete